MNNRQKFIELIDKNSLVFTNLDKLRTMTGQKKQLLITETLRFGAMLVGCCLYDEVRSC